MSSPIQNKLVGLISEALSKAKSEGRLPLERLPKPAIERPREKAHGDWSTNVAMVLAGELNMPPQQVAQQIVDSFPTASKDLKKIEIAGPGFINFYLTNDWLYDALAEIERLGSKYGHSNLGQGQRVQVEFVSANPVGPMHIGHGRWAAVGDSLANVLTVTGHDVTREFYVNDYGRQMDIFGASVSARYAELLGESISFPEEGYQGEYIKDIAREIIAEDGDKYLSLPEAERRELFKERAYQQVLEHIKKTLHDMAVDFDVWFSERDLHGSSAVKKAIDEVRERGYVYEKEGAVWFRSTAFGDEKDRVLIRENGEPTYLAADVAYHKNKLERGFDTIINIWGADHHGYVARMTAVVQALGYPAQRLEVILGQLVNLLRGGEPVRMSKRTGELVTLDELLAEVGKDAIRFLFLMRSTDSALDFDIDVAIAQSNENPVYYVQYAHARISSILRFAGAEGVAVPQPGR